MICQVKVIESIVINLITDCNCWGCKDFRLFRYPALSINGPQNCAFRKCGSTFRRIDTRSGVVYHAQTMAEISTPELIVEIGRRLDQRALIAGTDGNISARVGSDHVMVTPSGRHKGRLQPDDLVVTDLSGKKLHGRHEASSELLMHLTVYRERPDIAACMHAHPPHATARAASGRVCPPDILPEVVVFIGEIPLVPYAPPGTADVGRGLLPFLQDHDAFLLQNHGVLTLGRDLEEAYNRLETVEQYARILEIAESVGNLTCIPSDDMTRLKKLNRQYRNRHEV